MKQKRRLKGIKRGSSLLLCLLALCVGFPSQAVKISQTEYNVTIGKEYNFYLGNKKPVSGEIGSKVFLTYTVEDVEIRDTKDSQYGVLGTKNYKVTFPYLDEGVLRHGKDSLLEKGYTYVFKMERTEKGFEYRCAKLKGEKATDIVFNGLYGSPEEAFTYYGVWMDGLGLESATLSHVRCYDEKGNNLGVDTHRLSTVTISYTGELDDYSSCKAVYYCKDNDTLVVLENEKKASKQTQGIKEAYTYKVYVDKNQDTKMYLESEEGKEVYDYLYLKLTDEDGNKYVRLQPSIVTFVTGEEIYEAKVTASTGYRVEEPTAPSKEGNTFKEWCKGDGTTFDFGTVVTESITLYAKWQDEEGNEYIAVEQPETLRERLEANAGVVAIVSSATLAVGFATACVLVIKRKRKTNKTI